VPLRYELAYGGTLKAPGVEAPDKVYAPNPVGCGYLGGEKPDPAILFPAPQIEASNEPVRQITSEYRPEGLGPLSRWWQSRSQYAGTYDDQWRNNRFPDLPEDFDFAFYNSAHPGLVYTGYLDGEEHVALTGLFTEGELITQLPGVQVVALLADERGYRQPERLCLDTLTIDTDTRTAQLVWRRAVPRSWGLKGVVIGAVEPSWNSASLTT
jgi:hypothetical protein